MSIISRLSVVLGLDSAEFNSGLGKAEGGLNKFSATSGAAKVGLAALGTAMVAGAREALQFANEMTELAKANDMTVASVLELSSALSTSGGKLDNTSKIIASFTNKVDEAAQGSQKTRDKFKELGVSLSDIGKLSEQDLLAKTIAGLSKIEDPIRRNALAFDLLGKGIKGVDLKDFNNDLAKVKGTYDQSEQSFRRIEEWGNKIGKAWFDAKVSMANFIVAMVDAANKENELALGKRKYGSSIEAIFAGSMPGNVGSTSAKAAEVEKASAAVTKAAIGGGREVKASDELTKQLDKIQSQKEALAQNLMTIERQTKEIGTQKLLQDELLQQFQKGGKYDLIKDEALKKRLLDMAREYDVARLTNDVEKKRGEAILAFIEKGKELQQQVIQRKRDQQDSVDLQVKEIETQVQRLDYERQIANLSDIQREKALAYFDLKSRIVAMGQDPLWTDEQIARIETANQKMIEATEQTKRYENTFGVGFNRAFENFKEKATDSFGAGQRAFQSMTGNMESALDKFVQTGKISFSELASSIIADLIKIQLKASATTIFQEAFGGLGGLFGGLFGGGGGVSAGAGAYSIDANPFIGMYADGGDPPVGVPSLVGERGPELFVPRTAGTIIPNNSLSGMLGGQAQTVYNGPVVQNLNAIDTQSGIQFLTKNKDTIWAANQSAQRALPMSR